MSHRGGFLDSLASIFVPVHRDGHKFVAIIGLVAFVGFLLWMPLGVIFGLVAIYTAYFFRDPDRVTPLRDGLVISPADGKILAIESAFPPSELKIGNGERTRISIVLSIFDVHINRSPVAGEISASEYIPGLFVSVRQDKASEDNERRVMTVTTRAGDQIGVVQIAGFISRRIVSFIAEGSSIGVGERFGLIRFGSRVDVYLPEGKNALVATGQTVVAGETVLADLRSDEPEREARET